MTFLVCALGRFGQEIGATQPLEFFDPLDLAEDDPCWQPIRRWLLHRPDSQKLVNRHSQGGEVPKVPHGRDQARPSFSRQIRVPSRMG